MIIFCNTTTNATFNTYIEYTSAKETNHDIISLQEHRFIHEGVDTKKRSLGYSRLITCPARKNNVNADTGVIGILLNKQSNNALTKTI